MINRLAPCKVNLLLNVLGKRSDGFHEVESVMMPVAYYDRIGVARGGADVEVKCNLPLLGSDESNLVFRAVRAFLNATGIREGVRVDLEKRIPLAAGLAGGSSDAATTLAALNELFDYPMSRASLLRVAGELGSDVPFFFVKGPALVTGRGEKIEVLQPFELLKGGFVVLINPGFGVPTAWAYQSLDRFSGVSEGKHGLARIFIRAMNVVDFALASRCSFNSLEAPVFKKYPIISVFRDFLEQARVPIARMSGSGPTVFGITGSRTVGEQVLESFRQRFGESFWTALVPLDAVHDAG